MTKKQLEKEGIYMGEIDKMDPLYNVYAGTENVYVIGEDVYIIHKFENQLTYMGKNHIEEDSIKNYIEFKEDYNYIPADVQKVIDNLKKYQIIYQETYKK